MLNIPVTWLDDLDAGESTGTLVQFVYVRYDVVGDNAIHGVVQLADGSFVNVLIGRLKAVVSA
jgi:hypothetical protein